MFERQIKGIIAISVFLAIIPFIIFLTASYTDSKNPVLSTFDSQTLIIEIVSEGGESDIFFVEPGTSVNQMLSHLEFDRNIKKDIQLQNGMKVRLVPQESQQGIVIERMEAAKRLALGLSLDINQAGLDELLLVPGIGDALAANIIAWREKIGRFERLEQLMDIKGIKGKKMSKLSKYLYVDQL